MNRGPITARCRTISAGKPFLRTLAAWILANYSENLPKLLILMPSRRACRSLRDAFLECTGGKPMLLPRIQPIGDTGEDAASAGFDAALAELPPPINPLRRALLLTRMVMQYKDKTERGEGRGMQAEQAVELAWQLARLLDDAAREGLSFDGLSGLVPAELARHWQLTLDFLEIISRNWPAILEQEGALDPVQHRNLLMGIAAKAWEKNPPDYPVIAAGSTGSQKATAQLLSVIARLPQGMVVLPGLDKSMSSTEWEFVAPTHPQYGLKQLLGQMGIDRRDVLPLADDGKISARVTLLNAMFQPPESTADWMRSNLPLADGAQGLRILTADTAQQEARLIAVALREVLETPEKTAALVTTDRTLARMVAVQLQRFGIAIDDSAGKPLADTPPACFMRLLAEMAASQAAPVPLLSLLRHPLSAGGIAPADCRRLSRLLELDQLRGLRHEPGLTSLHKGTPHAELKRWLMAMDKALEPLMRLFIQKKAVPLKHLLAVHIECAEWLAASVDADGAERLWSGEAGNALASFLAELSTQSDLLDEVDPFSYPGLFEQLLMGQAHRPAFGLHPRLHILSPIEARLQQFDRVILGGLNEGTWPTPPESDPWMSRPMRHRFGLPEHERAIGQSAHDIYLLAAGSEVLLTRALKTEGTPTVPSRWLTRFKTLAEGLDASLYQSLECAPHYLRGLALIDAPQEMGPFERPSYTPPLTARPRQLRVTAIDKWLRDPYVIYAQYILKLNKLEPLDQEPDAADFGNLVHRSIDRFIQLYPSVLPQDALEKLLESARAEFSGMMDRPGIACLWWPRFEAMADWFIAQEQQRRGALLRVHSEIKGRWDLKVDGKPFTLTTRIDRLEIGKDGSVTLADYKTGTLPSDTAINEGLANQLPLEALIVSEGALEGLDSPGMASRMEYWKLASSEHSADIKEAKADIEAARTRLEDLIRRYDQASSAYTAQENPAMMLTYNDYEHLIRKQEWENG